MRLIPRDERFYTLLEGLVSHVTSAAILLEELFAAPDRATALIAEVKMVEHEADAIALEIVQRIDRSFMTPFDREDIHMLATKLDNVVDMINETAQRIGLFHITRVQPAARELAATVRIAGGHLDAAVHLMRAGTTQGAFAEHIGQIKTQEERGDAIYQDAVGALFATPVDALDLIKWKTSTTVSKMRRTNASTPRRSFRASH
jgi:predicted phosphate transport protein (TIGR00153 family)